VTVTGRVAAAAAGGSIEAPGPADPFIHHDDAPITMPGGPGASELDSKPASRKAGDPKDSLGPARDKVRHWQVSGRGPGPGPGPGPGCLSAAPRAATRSPSQAARLPVGLGLDRASWPLSSWSCQWTRPPGRRGLGPDAGGSPNPPASLRPGRPGQLSVTVSSTACQCRGH
jgi:hypothetical protein